MALSISKKMAISSVAFLVSVAALFVGLIVIGIQSARDSIIQSKIEQMVAIGSIKKTKIESFFDERQQDMEVLLKTVEALYQAASEKLQIVQQLKKNQIESYFINCVTNIDAMSKNKVVIDALSRFSSIFESINGNMNSPLFQYQDMIFGSTLLSLSQDYGFLDLYLINAKGDIVYSVGKGVEFGQNVKTGELRNSVLGKAFLKGLVQVYLTDVEEYAPFNNRYTSFITAPIKAESEVIGVLALQISLDPINIILQLREGMGRTGETYLVGKYDGKISYRCDIMGVGKKKYAMGDVISVNQVNYIEKALSGESVKGIYRCLDGKLVIVNTVPLKISGLNWACISQMEIEEAISPNIASNKEDYYEDFIKRCGYYDLFLIHRDGEIFYTVKHEDDYGTNILNGKYANTKFSELIKRVIQDRRYLISDYELYGPSNNEPAAFIAQPLVYDNQVELIVALQLSINPINDIMHEQGMVGSTSKTYLVGSDYLMRSDITVDKQTHSVVASMSNPTKGKIETEPVKLAISGQTGEKITEDYKGQEVICAYLPVKIQHIKWALLAEIDVQEVIKYSNSAKLLFGKFSKIGMFTLSILSLIIIIIVVKMILSLRNLILKPLAHVVDATTSLANYDLSGKLEIIRDDEMGSLMKAVNTMIESLRKIISSASEIAERVNTIAVQISDTVSEQAAVITQQSASVTEITSTMQEFAASSAQIAENSNSVVAIAASTLKSSQDGAESMALVMNKMKVIDENNQNNIKQIMELRKKTDEITKVMEIINSIADQTKLIAFNAALEASGAGEAGKRFGVVAVEIRRLADSVTASTGEIENKITEIQEASNHMVIASEKSTKGIQEAIVSFNQTGEMLNQILTEAMETTEAAKQISLSTQQQKTATEQIVTALRDISQGAEQTSAAINHISSIAKKLSELSDELKDLMKKFILPTQ